MVEVVGSWFARLVEAQLANPEVLCDSGFAPLQHRLRYGAGTATGRSRFPLVAGGSAGVRGRRNAVRRLGAAW